jgi:tetratricopeptide (TPR) repeat protein
MKKLFKGRAIGNIIFFIIGIAVIAIGAGLFYQSKISNREDITLYNKALETYDSADYFPATSMSLASYPIENLLGAIEYFQKAASISTDSKLQSMALSNIGTMIARDYLFFEEERSLSFGLTDAKNMLMEAVRLDPDNEYAKYNLEYIESLMRAVQEKQATSNLSHGGTAGTSQLNDLGF